MPGGEGRTLLVDVLDSVARNNPTQKLASWLKGQGISQFCILTEIVDREATGNPPECKLLGFDPACARS
jgi:hypothetical protein